MTVTPENAGQLYKNALFLLKEGFYAFNPNIALFSVHWTPKAIRAFLLEFNKLLKLFLKRRHAGLPIEIYSISELLDKGRAAANPGTFDCGFASKLMLHPDGNIYCCETPVTGDKHAKTRFKVGLVRGTDVSVDAEKLLGLRNFNIYEEFKLKMKSPEIAPLLKQYACMACDRKGGFLRKPYIQNALDIRAAKIEMILDLAERLKGDRRSLTAGAKT